jgi:hypothetical protein
MGPRVGTEGLGALPNYDAMNQVANAQQRAKYEAFMDAAKADGKSYAAGWNPETNRNEKQKLTRNDTRSSEYAIEQNSARHKKLGDERRLAQRAAVYGRHYGIPPAAATAGIQGMDALAANPNYNPTDIQRMGMGLPQQQDPNLEMYNQNRVLHAKAIGEYLANQGDPAQVGGIMASLEGAYPTRGLPAANGGQRQPSALLPQETIGKVVQEYGSDPERLRQALQKMGVTDAAEQNRIIAESRQPGVVGSLAQGYANRINNYIDTTNQAVNNPFSRFVYTNVIDPLAEVIAGGIRKPKQVVGLPANKR